MELFAIDEAVVDGRQLIGDVVVCTGFVLPALTNELDVENPKQTLPTNFIIRLAGAVRSILVFLIF